MPSDLLWVPPPSTCGYSPNRVGLQNRRLPDAQQNGVVPHRPGRSVTIG